MGGAALLCLASGRGTAAPQDTRPSETPPKDQSTTMPLAGAGIFRNYCAACHGVSGHGDGPVSPALKSQVPDLTTLARRNHGKFPAERVRGVIAGDEVNAVHGSREMPVWGPLFHQVQNDQDLGFVRLKNVTDYLSTIQQK